MYILKIILHPIKWYKNKQLEKYLEEQEIRQILNWFINNKEI